MDASAGGKKRKREDDSTTEGQTSKLGNTGKSKKKAKKTRSKDVADDDEADALKHVTMLKEQSEKEALNIIHHLMPRKIVYLSKLFDTNPVFSVETSEIVAAALPAAMQPGRDSASQAANEGTEPAGDTQSTTTTTTAPETTEGAGEAAAAATPPAVAAAAEAESAAAAAAATDLAKSVGDMAAIAEYAVALRIPANKHLHHIMAILKKEVLEMVYRCNAIKVWIQLNVPRIEDGNNFGVSIQEETISELARGEDSALSVLESMTKYHVTRARLVSKLIKYPQIDDYAQALIELDEKTYVHMRLCGLDLRNNHIVLHDLITKNLEKLQRPRSENLMHIGMY